MGEALLEWQVEKPPLHQNSENTGKNDQNQFLQNSENKPKN